MQPPRLRQGRLIGQVTGLEFLFLQQLLEQDALDEGIASRGRQGPIQHLGDTSARVGDAQVAADIEGQDRYPGLGGLGRRDGLARRGRLGRSGGLGGLAGPSRLLGPCGRASRFRSEGLFSGEVHIGSIRDRPWLQLLDLTQGGPGLAPG